MDQMDGEEVGFPRSIDVLNYLDVSKEVVV